MEASLIFSSVKFKWLRMLLVHVLCGQIHLDLGLPRSSELTTNDETSFHAKQSWLGGKDWVP